MSGRKLTLPPYPVLNAIDMSSSINSVPTVISLEDNVGVQLVWSGASPGGSIRLQVSMSKDGPWTTLQTMPGTDLVIIPAGTPDNAYIDVTQLSAPYIRVAYTTAGGSVGSLTATMTAKMV